MGFVNYWFCFNLFGVFLQNLYVLVMVFVLLQNNGFLSVYDGLVGFMNNGLVLNFLFYIQVGFEGGGYYFDYFDMVCGCFLCGWRGILKFFEDFIDFIFLQDILSWLWSFCLYKYMDNFKDMKWIDFIELDDK